MEKFMKYILFYAPLLSLLISLNAVGQEEPSPTDAEGDKPSAAPGPDELNDQALLAELAEAARNDEQSLNEENGRDAPSAEAAAREDPVNTLPDGARELLGNETNPSISIILDMAGAFFSHGRHLRQGGHAPVTNGPVIQGAELTASATIDPYFRLDMAFGLYHLHLEEIFATTTSLPGNLQIRAGLFKSKLGRHNPTHLHSWKFVIHPVANEFLFGAEGMGLPGAELSFLIPLPWYAEIIGALQMGSSGSFETDFSSGDPSFRDFIYPLRLVQFFDLSDDFALQLGINAVLGPSTEVPTKNRSYAFGADLMFKWRPIGLGHTGYTFISWTTEGWFRQLEVPNDLWEDIGGYSDLVFGIDKRWEVALRGELWKQLSGRDSLDRARVGVDMVRGMFSASFMPSHFSRLRLQYAFEHFPKTLRYDLDGLPTSQGPRLFDQQNHSLMVQLEVSAGSHGAHKY